MFTNFTLALTGKTPLLLKKKRFNRPKLAGQRLIYLDLVIGLLWLVIYPAGSAAGQAIPFRALANPGPVLSVDASAGRHPISPDIYGINEYNADPTLLASLKPPVVRWGGNLTSRYNWQVDASNHGSDWFFVGGDGITADPNPPSGQANLFIDNNNANGSKSLLTIPTINYINKSNDISCSFKVDKYPAIVQEQTETLWDGQVCGNGVRASDGSPIPNTDILYNHVPNTPALQQAWVNYLVGRYGNAAGGGVRLYEFDNEPSDWFETHRDVHPAILTYEELRDRTYLYGPAIKAADPTAQTLGPSDFGWTVYVESMDYNGRATHGGTWFAEWYLQQMKAYEDAHGVRILDYFDEHYYPDSNGPCISLCPAGDAANQAQRLRSTRSLWDPTYIDESWIGPEFGAIRLIPRFREWVNADYPGTKTAITEYNWGGLESLNGALTQADVLGIFGREQLDLATLWEPPTATQPGAYAFRMYLNYDGAGSAYGDTWVQSTSADQGQLAIYGAQRSSDNALTLMVINKTGNDLTGALNLSNFNPVAQAKVYRYSQANLTSIVRQPDLNVSAAGFTTVYPATSITLLVLDEDVQAGQVEVTLPNDDGTGNTAGTLSYALTQATAGQRIVFNLPPGLNTIKITGKLPGVKQRVNIQAPCGVSGPSIILDGSGIAAQAPGLTLLGNNRLDGIKIQKFYGPQLLTAGRGNRLKCVVAVAR